MNSLYLYVQYSSEIAQKYIDGQFDQILDTSIIEDNEVNYEILKYKAKILYLRRKYRMLIDTSSSLLKKMEYANRTHEYVTLTCLLIDAMTYLNKFNESNKMIDELSSKIKLDQSPQKSRYNILLKLSMARAVEMKGDPHLVQNYLQEIKYLLNEELNQVDYKKNFSDKIYLLEQLVKILDISTNIGDFESSAEIIETIQTLVKDLEPSFPLGLALAKIADSFIDMGEFTKALSSVSDIEKINDELDSTDLTFSIYNLKGLAFQYLGNNEQAISMYSKNLQIINQLDSPNITSRVYNNLGNLYRSMGEVDMSLDYLFKSLSINQKFGNERLVSTSLNNIALNYQIKGELDEALEYLFQALKINKQIGNEASIASNYINLGLTYQEIGSSEALEKAEMYYLKCLEIDRRYNNTLNLSEILFNLTTLALEKEDMITANEYLRELEELGAKSDNNIMEQRYKLAKAKYLKNSSRIRSMAKAQGLLMDIIEKEPVEFDLYIASLYEMAELLLIELNLIGIETILSEIQELILIMQEYANKQNIYSIEAESYLINSRLSLIELDFQKAQKQLEKAEYIALEHRFVNLETRISFYFDKLFDQWELYKEVDLDELSLQERIESSNLQELIEKGWSKGQNIITEPEEPKLLLVLRQDGNTIYSLNFDDKTSLNNPLIGGLFSAIQTLSAEIFETENGIQRIRQDDYSIVLNPIEEDMIFCYVFTGNSYNAIKKINKIIHRLRQKEDLWTALQRPIPNLRYDEKELLDQIIHEITSSNSNSTN